MFFLNKIFFYLKVSRPGLWFATIWLYLLPTSQSSDILTSELFWLGLFYVCFPLNFLVYGWNDVVDYETDLLNPRKGSYWFGARASKLELNKLWKPILVVQLFFIPLLIYLTDFKIAFIFIGFFIINWLYNIPGKGLRSMPPLELLCQIGYLLIVPLSILINGTDTLPWQTYLYLFLFSVQSHLMGEVMDIEPDKNSGRITTATILGMKKTKFLIITFVILEIIILVLFFKEYIFASVLGIGLLWLLLDLFFIFKDKLFNLSQMKLFALFSNLIGFITILYVWYTGCLLQIK